MKKLKNTAWLVVALQIILVVYVVVAFEVDNMALVKGEVHDFNTGWTVCREDGRRIEVPCLPYADKSSAYEMVVMEKIGRAHV